MRWAQVYYRENLSGILLEDAAGYQFSYDPQYFREHRNLPVSLTMPVRMEPYRSKTMFPFFDGLIPEGWMLHVTAEVWKIRPRDRMGLLLACCRDTIGAVHIHDMSGQPLPDEADYEQ